MPNLSMEQTRAQSDQELIRGGAIKSPDGHLAITDKQYEALHKEMESELFKQRVDEAQKIIGEMPSEQFESFQRELQYALKWWSKAYQESQTHILWNEGKHQETKAYDYYLNGKERIEAIAKSPLYETVRTRLRKEYDGAQNLPADWAGWLGLQSKQDMDNINGAISTMLRAELPIRGMVGVGVSADKLATAKETVGKYGIQGIFVENPTDIGLIATFHQHFGTKPVA